MQCGDNLIPLWTHWSNGGTLLTYVLDLNRPVSSDCSGSAAGVVYNQQVPQHKLVACLVGILQAVCLDDSDKDSGRIKYVKAPCN